MPNGHTYVYGADPMLTIRKQVVRIRRTIITLHPNRSNAEHSNEKWVEHFVSIEFLGFDKGANVTSSKSRVECKTKWLARMMVQINNACLRLQDTNEHHSIPREYAICTPVRTG
jgi:hypothetical protein